MGFEVTLKSWLSGLNPWMPLFAFVALFQLMRGAIFDALYFTFIVSVLFVNWKNIFPYEFPKKPKPNLVLIIFGAIAFGVAIALVPRKSPIEVALMVGALFIALALVWYKDSGPQARMTLPLSRSKWAWISFGVLVSLWELFAYILSDVANDPYAYPTISILMEPVMADQIGRAIFLVVWLLVGVMLVRIERKK